MGWAMSQSLPAGRFKWVSNPGKLKSNLNEFAKNPEKSYLLEVSMSYPNDLHDQHNDFPFMCEKRKINGVQKLVHNLYDKKKCVINIVALD